MNEHDMTIREGQGIIAAAQAGDFTPAARAIREGGDIGLTLMLTAAASRVSTPERLSALYETFLGTEDPDTAMTGRILWYLAATQDDDFFTIHSDLRQDPTRSIGMAVLDAAVEYAERVEFAAA